MIDHTLDKTDGILYVRPKAALAAADFAAIAEHVDPFIEANGQLAGIILEARSFPGWDSVAAMLAHLRFVREHHKHVRKIAAVTDSPIGDLAEKLAPHFVAAEIKHFPAGQTAAAKAWIKTS